MTPRVVVLTGPIRSGKTTRLAAWVRSRAAAGESVAGILAPADDDERRLCSIATGECRVLTAGPDVKDDRIVAIGPHRFDGAVFAWARGVIAAAATGSARPGPGWIVIDEVGPLEIRGAGLEPAVRAAVAAARGSASGPGGGTTATPAPAGDSVPASRASSRLVLVVREGLVERVLGHYGLDASEVRVVTPDELADLA